MKSNGKRECKSIRRGQGEERKISVCVCVCVFVCVRMFGPLPHPKCTSISFLWSPAGGPANPGSASVAESSSSSAPERRPSRGSQLLSPPFVTSRSFWEFRIQPRRHSPCFLLGLCWKDNGRSRQGGGGGDYSLLGVGFK